MGAPALSLVRRDGAYEATKMIQKMIPKQWMISYAGNREDVLLMRAFGAIDAGFYIDIGAYRPNHESVTKIFSDKGWSGINVEPGQFYPEFVAARPRDINLHGAVLDFDGEAQFIPSDIHPACSVVTAIDAATCDRSAALIVPAIRMETLVERYVGDRHVHFLKVDAEGSEPAIFASADWKSFRPEVILVEATAPFTNDRVDDAWNYHLTTSAYEHVYFDGINCWFVREESRHLATHFRIPVNQLDYFQAYDTRMEERHNELNRLTAENDKLKAQLADLRAAKHRYAFITRLFRANP
jgi:FkbM family methyltransferase